MINGHLTQQRFYQIIEHIETINKTIDTMDSIGMLSDNNVLFSTIDLFINLLQSFIDPTDDLISWWCFERDFGKDWNDHCMLDGNGVPIDLSDKTKLWNYLQSVYGDKNA